MNNKVENIVESLDEYKDIKLNLESVLGSDELSEKQKASMFLACSIALKNKQMIDAFSSWAKDVLDETEIFAAKSAAVIMGMNNVYYRTTHLLGNDSYTKMQSGLRMNIMAKHGVDVKDFELYSFAVSALNSCAKCLDIHEVKLLKNGLSEQQIHYTIRVASVLNSVSYIITLNEVM